MEQKPKQKKIPERQCLGCNEHKPKRELLRVVRTPEGEIVLDFTGKKSGRIARSLNVTVPDEVYDRMESELSNE